MSITNDLKKIQKAMPITASDEASAILKQAVELVAAKTDNFKNAMAISTEKVDISPLLTNNDIYKKWISSDRTVFHSEADTLHWLAEEVENLSKNLGKEEKSKRIRITKAKAKALLLLQLQNSN